MKSELTSTSWPIFVISLHDAHERRRSIRQQCAELGLKFEFFDAIDGRSGLPPEFEGEIDRAEGERNAGRVMTDAEYAAALSHRYVYKKILDEGLLGGVILEDDAVLSPYFYKFIAGKGYLEADLIQMMYGFARYRKGTRRQWSADIGLANLAVNSVCAAAYSISARGADYLISNVSRIAGFADWPCDVLPLHPLITLPRLATHPPLTATQSHLQSGRAALVDAQRREFLERRAAAGPRWKRFGRKEYWERWWLKRRTIRIAEPEGLSPGSD